MHSIVPGRRTNIYPSIKEILQKLTNYSSQSLHFKSVKVKFHPNMMEIHLAVFAYYSNRQTDRKFPCISIRLAAISHHCDLSSIKCHLRDLPDLLTAQVYPPTISNQLEFLMVFITT